MVEIHRVVVCAESHAHWDASSGSAKCRSEDHEHRVFEPHRQMNPVVLPDGTQLTAASFDPSARSNYCARAVETPEQEAFVALFDS